MVIKAVLISLLLLEHGWCYDVFQVGSIYEYRIESNVTIIPDVQKPTDPITQWGITGVLRVQRLDYMSLALQLNVNSKVHPDYIAPLCMPFKMISLNESSNLLMQHPQKVIEVPDNEPVWSANIKRSIASLLQLEGTSISGAFVSNEFGLFGLCPTEYYVVNEKTDTLMISKIYDMDRCTPYPGGIFRIRSNIPLNMCEQEKPAHAITSRLGDYRLKKLPNNKYLLKSISAETKTNVQATESYYPQFIFTKIDISLLDQSLINATNEINFNTKKKNILSSFTYVLPLKDATGGRAPKSPDQIISSIIKQLLELAERLEDTELNFDEPYMEIVSEIIRLIESLDFDALKKLYDTIDIGTSYKQETSKNIFLEILPRAGTASTVQLTKHLVVEKLVRPPTAAQLLISLPFFISELSADLIKECEVFLQITADRPDVKHAAVLSYSTMIYKAYVSGAINTDQFEKYVKQIFDLFLNSFDYEQQMLYLEAMGNLQLGNVPNYLQPIIQADYSQTTDIRFLAIFATMPTAFTRPDEVFETYWPIFYSKSSPLQLRIAAFTMLLVSSPTPGRLLGLYNVIKNENCPHMINFYRTTVLSISETTYSCMSHLKRLILYMRRHLPEAPAKKYWITGNYMFDYKDRKFQLGSMLQALLIGDRRKDLPLIVFLKFDTEALGRFTGQVGIYIKARGLSDAILDRLSTINDDSLHMDELRKVLKMMRMQPIQSTPLHLELVVQLEGKSIMSYYMNQTTFYNLTDGDIINRINTLLRADSHINMQIVRRPFMIKHGFSTLLGTPADILIESTLITSIRGSTTQNFEKDKLTRNNQIDFRYNSYAVAKIRSYNPIEDVEYSTIREQGFMVYLPLNNEIILNIAEQSLIFSLYRTEPITSGLALKSRTRNSSGSNKFSNDAPNHEFNLEDIGINVLIAHNVESSKENLMFLFEADVLDNAKVFTRAPYSVMQNILTLVSIIQLTSVHIARDKHLTILVTNQPKSKLEMSIKWAFEDYTKNPSSKEKNIMKVDCNLLHLLNYNDANPTQLHKWEFSSKYSTFKESTISKAMMSLNRKTISGEKWKLCISGSLDYLVLLKKPFTFSSNVVFGSHNTTSKKCPVDKSKVEMTITVAAVGPNDGANESYKNLIAMHGEKCNVIRFSPAPYAQMCDIDLFNGILAVNDISIKANFERMPPAFYNLATRADHLLSAVLPGNIDKLNLSKSMDLKIKLPSTENGSTNITLNRIPTSLPFSYSFNYGSIEQMSSDYGVDSICSVYKDNLHSFARKHITIDEQLKRDHSLNTEILMAAECSENPRLAIFVGFKENSNEFSHVKIYTAGHFITIKAERKAIIEFNGGKHNIRDAAFEYPQFEYDFKVNLKDDSILEIENTLIQARIQYNMENIISLFMPTIMRGKICGVCSIHKEEIC